MTNPLNEYLNFLDRLRDELEKLSELARKKTTAVRSNDLTALDDILKQEQAASLAFRGLEQKQNSLMNAVGLNGIPLSALADNYPPKMRLQAKQTVENLKTQYQVYRSCAEVARTTLECNLHEIEKVLNHLDQSVSSDGPGYQAKNPDLPATMKTDFRA